MKKYLIIAACFALVASLGAQTQYNAWDLATVPATGNRVADSGYGIGNDFRVVQPITVSSLGMFDSGSDGIQGCAVITIQLFQVCANKRSLLLESATFSAASPGSLTNDFSYKTLATPVTLLPGVYTLTAVGFDSANKNYDETLASSPLTVITNDGGGLIQFLGSYRYHAPDPMLRSKQTKNLGGGDRFAAGSFIFSSAAAPSVSYAGDYAALTAGVTSFPIDSGKSNIVDGVDTLNRYGSVALLQSNTFPVIVEPSGNRLIFEAAGYYNGDTNAGRCVAFAHEQWGYELSDARGMQLENAINWASHKTNAADIVIGLTTNLDPTFFLVQGYQVTNLDCDMHSNEPDLMPGCDVVVANFSGRYSDRFFSRLSDFTTNGGGLVSIFLPWRYTHAQLGHEFGRVNNILGPFGMAYRMSLTAVGDYGFTNLQNVPYPDVVFNAFPAANLLREDRLGLVELDNLQRAIALNTIAYAADQQMDRLEALTEAYSGVTNGTIIPAGTNMGSFVDVVTMAGSQANTNYLGVWVPIGNDLVAVNSRGSAEYDFTVSGANVYQIQVFGTQFITNSPITNAVLDLTLDGISLGQYSMPLVYGTSNLVECLTPYITSGAHALTIYWDNASTFSQLSLQSVHVQTAFGTDTTGDGMADWVTDLVNSESGMDLTNDTLTSYVSPMCLEGSDPYPSLMAANVSGADLSVPSLTPLPEPNQRWYVNAPLASSGTTTFDVSYQNGAKSETRSLQWLPVNVLDGGSYTIRKGDSLLLVARPDTWTSANAGTMQFTIGTTTCSSRSAGSLLSHAFNTPGTISVSGIYTDTNGATQSGTISVDVVAACFTNSPDCHVGEQREWDLPLPPEATFEADSRLFVEQLGPLAGGGAQLGLVIDQSEPRYFLSRLGTNGPVLASGVANGFNFWSGKDTECTVVQTNLDGCLQVQVMLVVSPVISDMMAKVDASAGGITFTNGATTQFLPASDFDSLGRYFMEFNLPAGAKTSVCHSIRIYQGGVLEINVLNGAALVGTRL